MDKYEVLSRYFGYNSFREGQETLIDSVLAGRDVLGVMPTGAGKSICYQVPALALPGITLVISPLISLMRDQVTALVQTGVPAAYINSSLSFPQFLEVLRRMEAGRYKLVYVAPERLSLERFQELCRRLPIAYVAVDEAHCVSQWGQDFRPNYLKIRDFLDCLDSRPVLGAYTATATDRVKRDIIDFLGLRDPITVTTGFDRPNLFFSVRAPRDKNVALLRELRQQAGRSGIVYCATRKKVEQVYGLLCESGYEAAMYHAGLEPERRAAFQEDFLHDRKTVMVATNAFGMGIDKSNVSFVIHYNMPKSVEAYYQEAGRAGRDGESADCVLLYGAGDVQTQSFLIENSEPNPDLTEQEQAQARRLDLKRLQAMKSYATGSDCLRGYILRYFGENPPARCGRCSNCLGDADLLDITVDAQKILSCVRRSGERYGPSFVAQLLHGDEDERVRQNGLEQQSTFGIMREYPVTQIRQRVRALIDQGLLREGEEYHVLSLDESAWPVLRGERRVFMREGKTRAQKKPAPAGVAPASVSPADERLYEKLRQLRAEIAQEENCPAFVIFSNAALRDMCVKRPRTEEELLLVTGVGQHKAARYGERFLTLIGREGPLASPKPKKAAPSVTVGTALEHETFGAGRVVEISGDLITVRFRRGRERTLLLSACLDMGIIRIHNTGKSRGRD